MAARFTSWYDTSAGPEYGKRESDLGKYIHVKGDYFNSLLLQYTVAILY